MTGPLARRIADEVGTPVAVVDLDVVDRNIARLQATLDAAGLGNRPHVKTHKSPELAMAQIAGGARGITVQKLGEAEVMAAAGIDDILVSYNLLGAEKMARLARLVAGGTTMTCAADNPLVLEHLATAGALAGQPIRVVIECDTGRERAGVATPAEAVHLARLVRASPHLAFAGILHYPPETGWARARAFHVELVAGLASIGLAPEIVSTGGSPNLAHLGELPGATEHRSGTSIFNDRMQMAAGVAGLGDCALAIYTTVVSRAGETRGILDAGSKTLTTDTGGLDGHGLILEYPEARIAKFAEEHGFLDLARTNARPVVGEVVRVVPNHVCVVVNMMDRLLTVRGDEIVGWLDVAARGRLS